MDSPPASGQGVPLQFVVIFIDALSDLVGAHGARTLLRRAGLEAWAVEPPPPTFEEHASLESVAVLFGALEDLYGLRGGRGLGRRMGAALVDRSLKNISPLAGLQDEVFQALPGRVRARVGLLALSRVLTSLGLPAEVATTDRSTTLTARECPFCYGRSLPSVGCTPLLGLVEATLRLSSPDLSLGVEETACRGTGGPACEVAVELPPAAP